MGREVRKVPANWEHPKNENGHYQPMFDMTFNEAFANWEDEKRIWDNNPENKGEPYEETSPDPKYYRPDWKDEERTHLMMYEDCSEGTPISPAFETPEELAKWLADNNASSFGRNTATYEQWLATIKRGWAVSAVIENGIIKSGVEAQ